MDTKEELLAQSAERYYAVSVRCTNCGNSEEMKKIRRGQFLTATECDYCGVQALYLDGKNKDRTVGALGTLTNLRSSL